MVNAKSIFFSKSRNINSNLSPMRSMIPLSTFLVMIETYLTLQKTARISLGSEVIN